MIRSKDSKKEEEKRIWNQMSEPEKIETLRGEETEGRKQKQEEGHSEKEE